MILIILGTVVIGVLYGIINLLLMPYLIEVFQSSAIPSSFVSMGLLLAAVLSIFVGIYIDKTNKVLRPICFFALTGALSLFLITSSLKWLASAGAVLFAMSTYSFLTPYSAFVSRYSKQGEYDKNFGYVMGTVNATTFLFSLIIGKTFGNNTALTLRIMSVFVTLPLIPAVIYALKNKKNVLVKTSKNTENNKGFLKHYPVFIFFLIMQFGIWFFLGAVFPYFTFFASSETGLALDKAIAWFGAFTLLSSLVSVASGLVTRKIDYQKLLIMSVVILVLISICAGVLYPIVIVGTLAKVFGYAVFVLGATATGFYYALNLSLIAQVINPKDVGKAFGINSVFMIVSQSVSVLIAGNVIETLGFRPLIFILSGALIVALAGIVLFRAFSREKRKA